MTPHTRNHRLAEEADQRRLEKLSDRDSEAVSDVSGELGLARFLAERCAVSSPGLCNSILSTISKLAIAAQHHAVANNELLARPALWKFTQEMIAIVCDELRPLPNGDAIIENICQRLDSTFAAVRNEPQQVRLLTHERSN